MTENQNPLAKHFRQPVIHFKLPSNGAFWPEGTLNLPVTGELPVYSMTTRDEVVIRTPDALLNGSGVTSVIQSCIPEIKDAWKMPSIDVDAVLIAIRIASYSSNMDIETTCPHCKAENTYGIDLHNVLANIAVPDFSKPVTIDGLTFKFKPRQYFQMNKANLVAFEEQKMINVIQNTELSESDRTSMFTQHLNSIVDLSNQLYVDSTEYILTQDNIKVDNPLFITEFYKNSGKNVTNQVKAILEEFSRTSKIKPAKVVCSECEKDFSVNLTFDHSHFFA